MKCITCSVMMKPVFHTPDMCPIAQAQAAFRKANAYVTAGSAPVSVTPVETPPVMAPVMAPVAEKQDYRGYVPSDILISAASVLTAREPYGNMMFLGPKGSGKTEAGTWVGMFVESLRKHAMPVSKFDMASYTTPDAFGGDMSLTSENGSTVTRYTESDFVAAMKQPGVVLLDEFNRVTDSIRQVLLPLLDGAREFRNPVSHTIDKRHPQCLFVMTGNVGLEYTGTTAIDVAFTDRVPVIMFTYAQPDVEEGILTMRTGVAKPMAALLVRFATDIRAKAAIDGAWSPVSTRQLIDTADYISRGMTPDDAVLIRIVDTMSREGGYESVASKAWITWTGKKKEQGYV